MTYHTTGRAQDSWKRSKPSAKLNIHVNNRGIQRTRLNTRIALLDTGADFNLISYDAFKELNLPIKPCNDVVRSIAGNSQLIGKVEIDWHFRPSNYPTVPAPRIAVHSAIFWVLSQDEDPCFDCILGWPWIDSNIDLFKSIIDCQRG